MSEKRLLKEEKTLLWLNYLPALHAIQRYLCLKSSLHCALSVYKMRNKWAVQKVPHPQLKTKSKTPSLTGMGACYDESQAHSSTV